MTIIVTNQEELDAAVESCAKDIVIDSPPDVWLELRGSSHFEVRGHSRVASYGYSRIKAYGHSHVVAWELTYVEAYEYSHIEAWEYSHVEAWGHSCVEAYDSSNVVAWEYSRVEAWDWTRVDALEWSIVYAWGDSCVNASPDVIVYVHCARATVTGGTIIDAANIDLSDPAVWVAYRGIATKGGVAVVYKSVSQELIAGQGLIPTTYTIGSTVEATDWDPTPKCGGGLHFSPTPSQAFSYHQGDSEPRFLACEVDVASLVPLDDKCKAPRCRVLHEVDQSGDPVVAALDTERETTP